ncbi:MAG: fabZ [Cyanobacteria bacterium RYN_339]|nr:fabZ [Cyanobacteria bacterium RYN_339]
MLGRTEIFKLLPHRPPMLMLDFITAYEAGKWIQGVKQVMSNDPLLAGHFPGQPIFPGALVIEALGQLTVALLKLDPANADRLYLFGGVDKMRFTKMVQPDAELILEARLTRVTATAAVSDVLARVGDQVVAKGTLVTGSVGP